MAKISHTSPPSLVLANPTTPIRDIKRSGNTAKLRKVTPQFPSTDLLFRKCSQKKYIYTLNTLSMKYIYYDIVNEVHPHSSVFKAVLANPRSCRHLHVVRGQEVNCGRVALIPCLPDTPPLCYTGTHTSESPSKE